MNYIAIPTSTSRYKIDQVSPLLDVLEIDII